jgi:hypothetical protein
MAQVMFLDPPLEQARVRWVQKLHQVVLVKAKNISKGSI